MLVNNSDRPPRLHLMANGYRVLSPGDHVVCTTSGARIPLDTLRYWSVEHQEPYASAQIASEALAPVC